ncbi:hypothetical protein SSX86_006965 [Deinandra increscens subsp. villosa]|uniref:F-box domain-containing protein n=1 Tax=Deinandra increscens subsp. villosa TaxID=3103831 RepID=A0AAP0H7C0_9ASTR
MSSMNEDDRLSRLPDDISSHILSLMPTKYAVQTSILSKRWRYTWMFVTNLDFDDIHPYHSKIVLSKFVDRAMKHCKSSQIHSFRLNFSKKYVKSSSVSSWIKKAVRLNVCEVDIQVITPELPWSLFTCKTLTKLKIDYGSPRYPVWECLCSVNLPCLKTLDIVVTTKPFVNAFKLISGCPVLESLSLEVTSSKDKKDYVFNIPTLKQLKLRLVRCRSVINKVVLNLPNLEYLFVGGKFDSLLGSLFVVEDLSSLVEASISFHSITFDHLFLELLKAIKGTESLSIEKEPGKYGFESLSSNNVPFTTSLPLSGHSPAFFICAPVNLCSGESHTDATCRHHSPSTHRYHLLPPPPLCPPSTSSFFLLRRRTQTPPAATCPLHHPHLPPPSSILTSTHRKYP